MSIPKMNYLSSVTAFTTRRTLFKTSTFYTSSFSSFHPPSYIYHTHIHTHTHTNLYSSNTKQIINPIEKNINQTESKSKSEAESESESSFYKSQGLFAVYKPLEWTSQDVVAYIRGILQRDARDRGFKVERVRKRGGNKKRMLKVGHGGTLGKTMINEMMDIITLTKTNTKRNYRHDSMVDISTSTYRYIYIYVYIYSNHISFCCLLS